jgi:hypothetical protein
VGSAPFLSFLPPPAFLPMLSGLQSRSDVGSLRRRQNHGDRTVPPPPPLCGCTCCVRGWQCDAATGALSLVGVMGRGVRGRCTLQAVPLPHPPGGMQHHCDRTAFASRRTPRAVRVGCGRMLPWDHGEGVTQGDTACWSGGKQRWTGHPWGHTHPRDPARPDGQRSIGFQLS